MQHNKKFRKMYLIVIICQNQEFWHENSIILYTLYKKSIALKNYIFYGSKNKIRRENRLIDCAVYTIYRKFADLSLDAMTGLILIDPNYTCDSKRV